jgi:nicotinamidase-related amidase
MMNIGEKMTSKTTALLIIDVQNDFFSEKGRGAKHNDVQAIQRIIPSLEKIREIREGNPVRVELTLRTGQRKPT